MNGNNIDLFNEYVSVIFAKLYEEFPLGVDINVEDVTTHKVEIDDWSGQANSPIPKENEIFTATAEWLYQSGYIITVKGNSPISEPGIKWATLTPKAMEALNTSPKSLSGGQSIGSAISEAAREGATETAKKYATQALSLAAGFVGQAVGIS